MSTTPSLWTPLRISDRPQTIALLLTLDESLPAGVGLRLKALNLRALFHAYVQSVRIDGREMAIASRFEWAAYRKDFKGVLWHYEGATVRLDRALPTFERYGDVGHAKVISDCEVSSSGSPMNPSWNVSCNF